LAVTFATLVVKFHVQVGSKRNRLNPSDLSVDFPSRYHTNFDEQADGIRGKPSISETGLSRDNLGRRLALRVNHTETCEQHQPYGPSRRPPLLDVRCFRRRRPHGHDHLPSPPCPVLEPAGALKGATIANVKSCEVVSIFLVLLRRRTRGDRQCRRDKSTAQWAHGSHRVWTPCPSTSLNSGGGVFVRQSALPGVPKGAHDEDRATYCGCQSHPS
jgi:hypothetical protein